MSSFPMTLLFLLIAAAALVGASGTAPDASPTGHQATRSRIGRSAVESIEKTCCLQQGAAAEEELNVGIHGVKHTAGPPPTPTGTFTPNHVEDMTSIKITAAKMTSYDTCSTTWTCNYHQSCCGPHPAPTVGTSRTCIGRSADAPATNAKAEAKTTALQHPRVCPISCPGEPTENLIFEGHASACAHVALVASAVDTIQDAAQTPEPPRSVLVIPTKTTAGTATGGRPPGVPLDMSIPDPVVKRFSALRRLDTSHQDPLNSVTIQVTINHTTKIVGQGGSALLPSARDDDKEDVSWGDASVLEYGCVPFSTSTY